MITEAPCSLLSSWLYGVGFLCLFPFSSLLKPPRNSAVFRQHPRPNSAQDITRTQHNKHCSTNTSELHSTKHLSAHKSSARPDVISQIITGNKTFPLRGGLDHVAAVAASHLYSSDGSHGGYMFQDDSQIHRSDSGVNNHLDHWEHSHCPQLR